MDEPISRAEHEEFAKRIDAQEKRQDKPKTPCARSAR